MKEEWLFSGAYVPVDVETTAALVAEIKRLIDVVGGMALATPEQVDCPRCGHVCSQRPWQKLTDEDIDQIMEMGLGVRASIETALDKIEEENT